MKREVKLFNAITEIRDDLIEEAQETKKRFYRPNWKRWGTIAAGIILALGIGTFALFNNWFPFGGSSSPGSEGGSGHLIGATTFMSYAGPVFPLTLENSEDNITAIRDISYDFALASEDSLRVWGSGITDSYTLENSSDEDMIIEGIYPFAGSFNGLVEEMPTIKVNGEMITPNLYPGGYSGGFIGIMGADDPEGSSNILELDSWEGYKKLLEDGNYMRRAFEDYPILSQKVTVYKFTDFKAPLEEFDAATQAISFTIDPEKTNILLYGFNGGEYNEDGFRRYSYFVPNGIRRETDEKYIIIVGEDIENYVLQGYKNGACEEGNELEGVSATVTRAEASLSDVFSEIVDNYFSTYDADEAIPVSRDMFLGIMSEFMLEHGVFSSFPKERYDYGMLEDIISETKNLDRVFYLRFPINIPAGKDASVMVSLRKKPSYDFYGSGSENVGVQGYDMVTRLGSNIGFTEITASLRNTDNIEILNQNFG
ncbi:MAG TPA: hypothetical protein VFD89_03635, partial [Clostridia bacterium]|nr:hypothetical protein [Clostridia bacterium]